MNFLEIEQLRLDLHDQLSNVSSVKRKILLIHSFFSKLFTAQDKNLRESFSIEFAEVYFSLLKKCSPECSPQNINAELCRTTELLIENLSNEKRIEEYKGAYNNFKTLFAEIERSLRGEPDNLVYKKKPYFPLIEKLNNGSSITIGALESVTISIDKSKGENTFIVIPSETEAEETLLDQIKTTFHLALKFIASQVKNPALYHKVIISFDRKLGIYKGESLGISLLIAFIEELLSFYNAPMEIRLHRRLAFTGGVDSKYNILPIGAGAARQKVEHLFNSGIRVLVVPKEDENEAVLELKKCKKEFPHRVLTIVGIERFDDLLNRRDLIDIKKVSLPHRAVKTMRQHWYATVITLLLLVFAITMQIYEFDDNPAILENEPFVLLVKNKSGRVLWMKKVGYQPKEAYDNCRQFQMIVDIDNDGKNEIILANEDYSGTSEFKNYGRVTCYNSKGRIIWKYKFQDSASSEKETMDTHYGIGVIIDTLTEKGEKEIFLSANNFCSYAGALFKLNARSGERMPGTLWNAGHIISGFFIDLNKTGKKYLFFSFINNSYEKSGFGIINPAFLEGFCPSTAAYRLRNIANAPLEKYILFPNSDYNKYLRFRNNRPEGSMFRALEGEQVIRFLTNEGLDDDGVSYFFDYDLKFKKIVISSTLRVHRDSLVAGGKLTLPLTDTPEYGNTLSAQILYWNGRDFVHLE